MKHRVCVCCGEPILEGGNAFARNPNVCASCSRLPDGLEESEVSEPVRLEQGQLQVAEKPWEIRKAA